LPGGEEKEIVRKGPPTILEGKRILKASSKQGANVVVLELMSIQPESLFVESVQMIKPHILVITNVRADHLAQMGPSKDEIAGVFSSSISKNCTVFVPEEEFFPVFQKAATRVHSKIIEVPLAQMGRIEESEKKHLQSDFSENRRIAMAVADFLGVDKKTVCLGIARTPADFGGLKVWVSEWGSPPCAWYCVSGFAANDPESTRCVLSRLRDREILKGRKVIGLLNFRTDRGDRTLQWLSALKAGDFPE
ncbi:unnamed protein product, partial [marine sediment metagenome]